MQTRITLPALAFALLASAAPAFADRVGDLDREFLTKTQQANFAELAAAKYTIAHSDSARAKSYALTIEESHTVAVRDVEIYAKGAGVDLPTGPSDEQVAKEQQLEKLSGTAYVKAYLSDQIEGHTAAVALARQEARYGQQSNVTALARQLINQLAYHLSLARETLASVNDPVQSGELAPARKS